VWTFLKLQERVSRYYNARSEEKACCLSVCKRSCAESRTNGLKHVQAGEGCFTASIGEHILH
jgi:hypothetical protein